MSEPEITSVRGFYSLNILTGDLSDLFFWNFFKLTVDHLKADFLSLVRSVVNEILGERHERIGMTAVENLTALAKAHKSVACSALSVAGGTERRNMILFHKPSYNLVKRSLVGNIKLLRIMGTFLLTVSAD